MHHESLGQSIKHSMTRKQLKTKGLQDYIKKQSILKALAIDCQVSQYGEREN